MKCPCGQYSMLHLNGLALTFLYLIYHQLAIVIHLCLVKSETNQVVVTTAVFSVLSKNTTHLTFAPMPNNGLISNSLPICVFAECRSSFHHGDLVII